MLAWQDWVFRTPETCSGCGSHLADQHLKITIRGGEETAYRFLTGFALGLKAGAPAFVEQLERVGLVCAEGACLARCVSN